MLQYLMTNRKLQMDGSVRMVPWLLMTLYFVYGCAGINASAANACSITRVIKYPSGLIMSYVLGTRG